MTYSQTPPLVSVLLGLCLFTSLNPPVLANLPIANAPVRLAQNPPRVGRPGTARHRSDRDERCPSTTGRPALTAIVLEQEIPSSLSQKRYSVSGITTSATPTLWFYVPYTSADNLKIAFALNDGNGNPIKPAQKRVELGPQSGIIGIQIPPTANLQPGKAYQWFFQVFCGDTPQEVTGWIERVATAPPTTAGTISYDRVSQLAEQQQAQPQQAKATNAWQQLLAELGWPDLQNQPVLTKQ